MNIVVSNVKGGVGKTTTAVYLAAVGRAAAAAPSCWSTPTPRARRLSGTTPIPSRASS